MVFRSQFIACVYIPRVRVVCLFQRSIEVCLDLSLIRSFLSLTLYFS